MWIFCKTPFCSLRVHGHRVLSGVVSCRSLYCCAMRVWVREVVLGCATCLLCIHCSPWPPHCITFQTRDLLLSPQDNHSLLKHPPAGSETNLHFYLHNYSTIDHDYHEQPRQVTGPAMYWFACQSRRSCWAVLLCMHCILFCDFHAASLLVAMYIYSYICRLCNLQLSRCIDI